MSALMNDPLHHKDRLSPPQGMWAQKLMNGDEEEQGGWGKGVRRQGKGNDEAGETAGEGRGSLCPLLPFFCSRGQ